MGAVKVDPWRKSREVKGRPRSFYTWLRQAHDKGPTKAGFKEFHKVNSRLKDDHQREAIDVVLCWGWKRTACPKGRRAELSVRLCPPRPEKNVEAEINVGKRRAGLIFRKAD